MRKKEYIEEYLCMLDVIKNWHLTYTPGKEILTFVYHYNGKEKISIFNSREMSLKKLLGLIEEFSDFCDTLKNHVDYQIESNPDKKVHIFDKHQCLNINAIRIRLLTDKAISMFMLTLSLMEEK